LLVLTHHWSQLLLTPSAPGCLTSLLLPLLSHGRVVNVAAETFGTKIKENSVQYLREVSTHVDPILNSTGGYFGLSKYLLIHHAVELAARAPDVTAIAVNPGYAILPSFTGPLKACTTNEKGLQQCPQHYSQAASVLAVAAAWPGLEEFSGSYLDYETKALPPGAPYEWGPWTQNEPTCVPRDPPAMDPKLRSERYDEMLSIMH